MTHLINSGEFAALCGGQTAVFYAAVIDLHGFTHADHKNIFSDSEKPLQMHIFLLDTLFRRGQNAVMYSR